jgi:hypothetical protein
LAPLLSLALAPRAGLFPLPVLPFSFHPANPARSPPGEYGAAPAPGEYEYADGAYEDDAPVPEYPSPAPFGFPVMLPSENGPLIVGGGGEPLVMLVA